MRGVVSVSLLGHASRVLCRPGISLSVGVALTCAVMAGPASASTWSVPYPSADFGSDPVVADGRVWWAINDRPAGRMVLFSRAADGTRPASVVLDDPGPLDPANARRARYGPVPERPSLTVRGQRVYVGQQWEGAFYAREPPLVAAYDRRSGARSATIQQRSGGALLSPGSDVAIVRSDTPGIDGTRSVERRSLADPPGRVPDASLVETAGTYELHVLGSGSPHGGGLGQASYRINDSDAHDGWERAEVRQRTTGRLVYRVSSTRLARLAAPRHRDGRVGIARLLPDGSLAIVASYASDGHRGLQPIAISGHGKTVRVGGVLPRANIAGALASRGRGLISVLTFDTAPRCEGLWLTDGVGRRARRISRAHRSFAPVSWTGATAVWPGERIDPDLEELEGHSGRRYITVDTHLHRVRLRRGAGPRC